MKILKWISLLLLLPFIFSCTSIKTAVNNITYKNPIKSKFKPANQPKDIKNSTPDKHAAEETALIVTLSGQGDYYIGENQYSYEVVTDKLDSEFRKHPSESQLIYLNCDIAASFGDVAKLLDAFRKTKVENVGLLVSPAVKTDVPFDILKVKIPDEPTEQSLDNVKPNPLKLVVSLQKDDKLKLNSEAISADAISAKLTEIFKGRESNGVFRAGTNEIEKTVSIKSRKSDRFVDVVRVIDAVAGAGASSIYLEIDDLEQ
ncbi:MAG TPA: biopolymer transporter ExbD [Pyrinomonadaceae bacterium]|jgi:biopolymer transport protein ExbD